MRTGRGCGALGGAIRVTDTACLAARSAARSLGLGFSSLASTVLIHVLKTHKLETKGITREFYLSRIFPLGFLMVRARHLARSAPEAQLASPALSRHVAAGAARLQQR